jgi:hypothetical protein
MVFSPKEFPVEWGLVCWAAKYLHDNIKWESLEDYLDALLFLEIREENKTLQAAYSVLSERVKVVVEKRAGG